MPVPAGADVQLLHQLWSKDLAREHGFEPLEIEGTLPANLRGTLYRNGPGQFGQFGRRYDHPFEGDGAITAIRFDGGRAQGASKLHQTTGLREERAAGTSLYGMAAPWHRRIRNAVRGRGKNTANTSVMAWQGRLFALMEAGKPTEVNPLDLATVGETDLGGVVRSFFSAHPHRVESRKASYNFGLTYGRQTLLELYELPDTGAARHLGSVPLAGPPMLHDFIATDTHLIFFVSPVRVNVPRMLVQVGRFDQLFQWKPELGTEILCIPIADPGHPVRFSVDAFYQWHFANAFDRGSELVVDYVRYAGFRSFNEMAEAPGTKTARDYDQAHYHRAVIDLRAKTFRSEPLSDRGCEFPTLEPGAEGRAHTRAFVALDGLRSIGAIDTTTGVVTSHTLEATAVISEPLFVDGHLVALGHTRDRAFAAVYDAARIPDGPVARAWFDHHVPITFHGTYVPA